jgi:hypothetical protein
LVSVAAIAQNETSQAAPLVDAVVIPFTVLSAEGLNEGEEEVAPDDDLDDPPYGACTSHQHEVVPPPSVDCPTDESLDRSYFSAAEEEEQSVASPVSPWRPDSVNSGEEASRSLSDESAASSASTKIAPPAKPPKNGNRHSNGSINSNRSSNSSLWRASADVPSRMDPTSEETV